MTGLEGYIRLPHDRVRQPQWLEWPQTRGRGMTRPPKHAAPLRMILPMSWSCGIAGFGSCRLGATSCCVSLLACMSTASSHFHVNLTTHPAQMHPGECPKNPVGMVTSEPGRLVVNLSIPLKSVDDPAPELIMYRWHVPAYSNIFLPTDGHELGHLKAHPASYAATNQETRNLPHWGT